MQQVKPGAVNKANAIDPPTVNEFCVGDVIPLIDHFLINQTVGMWSSPDSKHFGVVVDLFDSKTFEVVYKSCWIICNGVIASLPFGLMVFETQTLLLDNNPTDKIIDEIVDLSKGVIRPYYVDAPECTISI